MILESELNAIKGLLHYLNHEFSGIIALDPVTVIDSNGEKLCEIAMHEDSGQYAVRAVQS